MSDALLARIDARLQQFGPDPLMSDLRAALAERIPREPTEREKRLAKIEHLVWHCLDDSEERDGEQVIAHNDDFRKLVALLSEDHPTTVAVGGLAAVPGIPRERDAERYRWLREEHSDLSFMFDLSKDGKPLGILARELLDAAIDAAISGDSHG